MLITFIYVKSYQYFPDNSRFLSDSTIRNKSNESANGGEAQHLLRSTCRNSYRKERIAWLRKKASPSKSAVAALVKYNASVKEAKLKY